MIATAFFLTCLAASLGLAHHDEARRHRAQHPFFDAGGHIRTVTHPYDWSRETEPGGLAWKATKFLEEVAGHPHPANV